MIQMGGSWPDVKNYNEASRKWRSRSSDKGIVCLILVWNGWSETLSAYLHRMVESVARLEVSCLLLVSSEDQTPTHVHTQNRRYLYQVVIGTRIINSGQGQGGRKALPPKP